MKVKFMLENVPLVGNDSHIAGMWMLADRLIQQVALQQKNGQDPDCVPVEMNVKQMVRQLVSLNLKHFHVFGMTSTVTKDTKIHVALDILELFL
jgi:hypothetical protein